TPYSLHPSWAAAAFRPRIILFELQPPHGRLRVETRRFRSKTVSITDEVMRVVTGDDFLDAFRELRGASRRIAQDKGKAAPEDRSLRVELSSALLGALPRALREDPDSVTCALTDAANDTRLDPLTRADLKSLRQELLAELT